VAVIVLLASSVAISNIMVDLLVAAAIRSGRYFPAMPGASRLVLIQWATSGQWDRNSAAAVIQA
jgi:hypothetical protein